MALFCMSSFLPFVNQGLHVTTFTVNSYTILGNCQSQWLTSNASPHQTCMKSTNRAKINLQHQEHWLTMLPNLLTLFHTERTSRLPGKTNVHMKRKNLVEEESPKLPKSTEGNFMQWRRWLRTRFDSVGILDCIKRAKPGEAEVLKLWEEQNKLAVSII